MEKVVQKYVHDSRSRCVNVAKQSDDKTNMMKEHEMKRKKGKGLTNTAEGKVMSAGVTGVKEQVRGSRQVRRREAAAWGQVEDCVGRT